MFFRTLTTSETIFKFPNYVVDIRNNLFLNGVLNRPQFSFREKALQVFSGQKIFRWVVNACSQHSYGKLLSNRLR
jgi:hypothetical protein